MEGIEITLAGRAFVAVPLEILARFTAGQGRAIKSPSPAGSEAKLFIRSHVATGLRAARAHAGWTQAELARRLEISQARISKAESGAERAGEALVTQWLKACGLPEDWKPSANLTKKSNGR